jgi:glycine cleavage system aminomethyltransferase T
LAYEINVRSSAAGELWEALMEAGKEHGIQPFGLDALLLMRLEKRLSACGHRYRWHYRARRYWLGEGCCE